MSKLYCLLDSYINSEFLQDKKEILSFRMALERLVNNDLLDATYKLEQMINARQKIFLSDCSKYDQEAVNNQRLFSEFNKLRLDYEALCGMLGEEPQPVVFDLSLGGAKSISELANEIERVKARMVEKGH